MSLEYEPGSAGQGAAGDVGQAESLGAAAVGGAHTGDAKVPHATDAETGDAGGGQSRQRWRLLDDPVAIRALAHPLRVGLMTVIARLGRATTADAAREMGISHGLASHHLRQLAKYGFLEQVKGKDHRERPWRLVATSYNWSGARATTEGSVAVDVLEQMTAERTVEAFLDWQQRRKDWPQGWREHAGLGESTVYLTQAELAGIDEAIDAVLMRYIDERPIDDVASRPEGSVPVTFTLFAVPGGPPQAPGTTTEA